ncbi:GNAT family N-acetyltransferase [Halovivax limisalsi]|uniref:GNAT family N-acetyltransferase n=1 Tax=Halovivax limisalsi TaxID=1453760 RepID=UPI001FFC5209|nr:GNAT family protein [Halovivax limisalsi]
MPGPVFCRGDRLDLRAVEQTDVDRRFLGYVRNDPDFRRALGFDSPWPRGRTDAFLESTLADESNCNCFVCPRDHHREAGEGADGESTPPPGAERALPPGGESALPPAVREAQANADHPVAGAVNLFDVDRVSGTLSYWLFDAYRGRGYASEAVSLLVDVAFADLGLHRIEAEVFAENDDSRRLLERLGFVHEGTMRECRITNGDYGDVDRYAVLEDAWRRERCSDADRRFDAAPDGDRDEVGAGGRSGRG